MSEEINPSSQATDPSPVDPPTLDPVIVLGNQEDVPNPSASKVTKEMLEALPLRGNQVNEILKILPHVQVSDSSQLSTQGGEIFPPELSISGGRTYRNNYQVDGFGANSFLNPASDNYRDIDFLPGHSTNTFLNTNLIESVTVYDSNVSAELGGFTGGVTDVKTKDPGPDFGGNVYYRTTRDAWTSFHLSEEEEEAFLASRDEKQQPRFHKVEAGAEINLPLNDRLGLLFGYSILHSEIPLYHLNSTEDQTRQIENWFAKGLFRPSPLTALKISFLSTPGKSTYFTKNAGNSRFSIEEGGYRLGMEVEHFFSGGVLNLSGAYARSGTDREAAQYFQLYNYEGSFGSLEVIQREIQIEGNMTVDPVRTVGMDHVLRTGFKLHQVRGHYKREETMRFYISDEEAGVFCGNSDGCIEGERYFDKRNIYELGDTDGRMQLIDWWGEDRIQFGRIALRPGVRLSWDDLMENFEMAPRMAGTLDVFGGGGTLLLAGVNRYYASPMLFSALREGISPRIYQTRSINDDGTLTAWKTESVSTTTYPFRKLETPYTDEFTAGIDQRVAGGRLVLKYVRRDGEDEYAREKVTREVEGVTYKDYVLNNSGHSRYEGYSMAWERHSDHFSLGINATYIATNTTSNVSYDSFFDEETAAAKGWFKEEAVFIYDLPKDNYNRTWTGNLVFSAPLPWGFAFTNVTRYRSGYVGIEKTKEDKVLPDGEVLDIYEEFENPESWIFDWKLAWTSPAVRGNSLTLTVEVLNVFNKEILAGEADDEYEIGRQLWAGAEWRF